MRKTLAVLSVLSILGTAGAALAEEAMGKIQAVDPATRTLTLEDGSSFVLAMPWRSIRCSRVRT